MIEIQLTRGYTAIVDDEDADLTQYKWFAVGSEPKDIYAGRAKNISMHRVVGERIIGRKLRLGEEVDHIKGNTRDNRRKNLRVCTHPQNLSNRKKPINNTSGFKGVTKIWSAKEKSVNKWKAQITVNKKYIHIGNFQSAELANEAYKEAAIKYFGEFARFE